jgi:predicted acylesterase/phospholipase RssA
MLPDLRRPYLRHLQAMELVLMRAVVEDPRFLTAHDESAMRWALSLARISKVVVQPSEGNAGVVDIEHATNDFRERLYRLLEPCVDRERVVSKDGVRAQAAAVRQLAANERKSLLQLFGHRLPYRALDRSTRRRPLALAMGGGGGTGYVYVGAMAVLDEAGLVPSLIAGTSMGAILGAFRCRIKGLDLSNIRALLARLSWRKVFRLFETGSRFGLPATLKLYLREVIGQEFEREGGGFLTLDELEIPLRVTLAGLVEGPPERKREMIDRYAPLLDGVNEASALRKRAGAIARALAEFTKQPVRAIYVGGDPLTKNFDVLDAVGFSSAVPGLIHYDILRDDPRMVQLCETLMAREGVFRFVDGGLADNLPAREAWRSVQAGACAERDPFVVALDAFVPQLSTRHLLFLPLMRIASENSRIGREVAHLTISFRNVLSPLSVVPSSTEFVRAMQNGKEEMAPYVTLIRKMVGPIPDPPGVLGDGG